MTQVQKLIKLAEKIGLGIIPAEEALLELRNYTEVQSEVAEVVHFLYHFLADADIRAKDAEYSEEQQRHFHQMVEVLNQVSAGLD